MIRVDAEIVTVFRRNKAVLDLSSRGRIHGWNKGY
jgi:hypothetical protein